MLTCNLIVSGVVALAAFSLPIARANANLGPSADGRVIGALTAASQRIATREGDEPRIRESIELLRGLCELGNLPRRLSDQDLDLCVRRSL